MHSTYGYAEIHGKIIFISQTCYFKEFILKQGRLFKLELNMFTAFAEDRQYKQTNLSDKFDNKCFHFCRKQLS